MQFYAELFFFLNTYKPNTLFVNRSTRKNIPNIYPKSGEPQKLLLCLYKLFFKRHKNVHAN